MNINVPTVSVVMITYQHESYIREAVEGVLMQQCSFDVELIIANDCSPDNTRHIIHEIIDNHPNGKWIKYIEQETNLGMIPNFIYALKECKGQYIALCEGDDYWTHPLKLQKQVDFLSNNFDYSMCFHEIYSFREGAKEEQLHCSNLNKVSFALKDIVLANFIPTCSVLLRKACLPPFNYFYYFRIGDWPLYIYLLTDNYNAFFINEPLAKYRIHPNGIFSQADQSEALEISLSILENAKKYFNRNIVVFNSGIIKLEYALFIRKAYKSGKLFDFLFLKKIIFKWGGAAALEYQIKALFIILFPCVYKRLINKI